MTPEFVDAPSMQLVALSGDYSLETRSEIPALWQDFWSRNWPLEGDEEPAAFGVSYGLQADGRFSYAAGRHVRPLPDPLPEGACAITLSGGRYAVFRNEGPVSEMPAFFDAIFGQWLPGSGETQREGAVFERYPNSDDASPEHMAYEIWVPVTQ